MQVFAISPVLHTSQENKTNAGSNQSRRNQVCGNIHAPGPLTAAPDQPQASISKTFTPYETHEDRSYSRSKHTKSCARHKWYSNRTKNQPGGPTQAKSQYDIQGNTRPVYGFRRPVWQCYIACRGTFRIHRPLLRSYICLNEYNHFSYSAF